MSRLRPALRPGRPRRTEMESGPRRRGRRRSAAWRSREGTPRRWGGERGRARRCGSSPSLAAPRLPPRMLRFSEGEVRARGPGEAGVPRDEEGRGGGCRVPSPRPLPPPGLAAPSGALRAPCDSPARGDPSGSAAGPPRGARPGLRSWELSARGRSGCGTPGASARARPCRGAVRRGRAPAPVRLTSLRRARGSAWRSRPGSAPQPRPCPPSAAAAPAAGPARWRTALCVEPRDCGGRCWPRPAALCRAGARVLLWEPSAELLWDDFVSRSEGEGNDLGKSPALASCRF